MVCKCKSAECNVFLGTSWKVRRKYRETAMAKSKNKYDYAEYDVIRVIIVSFAGTSRLAKAAARNGSAARHTPTHGGLRRVLGGVCHALGRVVAISGPHGVVGGVR